MTRLLVKDLRLVAPYAWVAIPAHVLWCAQAFLSPGLYFWFSLGAALAWTPVVLAIEWQLDADRFVASLPVTRAAVVHARYASALGSVIAGAVLYVLYGHALMAVAPERLAHDWSGVPQWWSGGSVLAFATVGYVLVTAFLPFHFRFRFPMGAGLFAVSAIAAGSIAVALVKATAATGARGPTPGPGRGGAGEMLAASFASLATGATAPWGLLALLAGAGVLGYVSIRLSVRFYARQEL